MNKEFIKYEQALALKELGFDEPCLKYWNGIGEYFDQKDWFNWNQAEKFVSIPLYQQAFRWFREKHRISPVITCYSELGNAWKYHIPNEGGEQGFYTYEEAELACLIKLIEIVKQK